MIARLLFLLGMRVVPWVPRRLAYASARLVARMIAATQPAALRAAAANQAVVQDQPADAPSVLAAARAALALQALNYVDLLQLRRLERADIERRVAVRGYEHLQQAQQAGRGVIMVSAHLGNLDLVGQVFALRGQRVLVPVERIHPPSLYEQVRHLRARHGITLTPADAALRPALRALRRGEIVALLADWDALGTGVPVRFFGRDAWLPRGPAVLHLRTGAPIVPCFGYRRPDGNYQAWVEPALAFPTTGDVPYDALAIMQCVGEALAAAIRRSPEQWVLFHSVWPRPSEADGSPAAARPSLPGSTRQPHD